MMLNILLFTNFRQWSGQEDLNKLVEFAGDVIDPDKEMNLVFICYNPIIAICLLAETMKRIGEAVKFFGHTCACISDDLLRLGEKLIETMDETIIESVFTETDFLNRSVLKIICANDYEPLMRDHKVSDLLDLLWVGKATYDCNGRDTDFSLLGYLSIVKVRKLEG